jgi:hypothetical protein
MAVRARMAELHGTPESLAELRKICQDLPHNFRYYRRDVMLGIQDATKQSESKCYKTAKALFEAAFAGEQYSEYFADLEREQNKPTICLAKRPCTCCV